MLGDEFLKCSKLALVLGQTELAKYLLVLEFGDSWRSPSIGAKHRSDVSTFEGVQIVIGSSAGLQKYEEETKQKIVM